MASIAHNPSDNPETGGLTVGSLMRTISRNSGVFWTTLVVGLVLAALLSALMPPKFASFTEILVEGASPNGISASPENVIGELTIPNSAYTLATQQELLQSQEVYFQVLEQVGIARPQSVEDIEKLPQVTVRQKTTSNVFMVLVEGKDEEVVENIAAAYPEVFRRYYQSQQEQSLGNAVTFISARIQEEKDAIQTAENNLADFKLQYSLADSGQEITNRVTAKTTIEQDLATAESRVAASRMAVAALQTELSRMPKTRVRTDNRTNLEELVRLKSQRSALLVSREDYVGRYLPSSVQVRELDAKIAAIDTEIASMEKTLNTQVTETNPQVWDIEGRLSAQRAELAAATAARDALAEQAALKQAEVDQMSALAKTQRELEREIAAHAQALERLNAVNDQFKLRNNSLKTMVNNLRGTVPAQQTQPNWLINMVVASILSLAFALIFSIARDSIQDRVNTVEEAYALTNVDILARIPERSRSKSTLITDPQTSIAFESYRVLRSVIGLMSAHEPIKSLAITSTLQGEGKTVVTSNLAVAFALNGQRVVLVDSNFRNPAVGRLFGKQEKPGLGDVLLGNAKVSEVMQETPVPGLYVITAGTTPANATEALGSERMKSVIDEIGNQSDMVLFDCPAVLGLADAPSLATHCDASAMVTVLGKSTKAEFQEAVGLMQAASRRMIGLVHNRLKAKQTRLNNV